MSELGCDLYTKVLSFAPVAGAFFTYNAWDVIIFEV